MALTGSDLLTKVKEQGDASKSDLVRAAGYVSTKKDGSERLNFTAFYEALLEAKGVSLGEGGGNGKGQGWPQLELCGHGAGQGLWAFSTSFERSCQCAPASEATEAV